MVVVVMRSRSKHAPSDQVQFGKARFSKTQVSSCGYWSHGSPIWALPRSQSVPVQFPAQPVPLCMQNAPQRVPVQLSAKHQRHQARRHHTGAPASNEVRTVVAPVHNNGMRTLNKRKDRGPHSRTVVPMRLAAHDSPVQGDCKATKMLCQKV